MQKNRKISVIFCFVLCATILATYWQLINHEFINFDDNAYIYENSKVQAGLTTEGIIWAFTSSDASNWHPITWTSHMIDVQFFGMHAGRHHLVNVLFHLINSLLLFLFLNGTTKKIWPSFFVSLLFALHPLHIESVAWAAERKDVLSTLFMLLTLIGYSKYIKRPNFKLYCIMSLIFILGLMSKPMLVTLPFLLLLTDFWPLNRYSQVVLPEDKGSNPTIPEQRPAKFLIYEKIPLFILASLSCVITFLVQQQSGAIKTLQMMPIKLRIANAIVSYVEYLYKLVWPVNLTILYPYPSSIPLWKIVASLAIIMAATMVVVKMRKKYPFLLVGWFWYLGTMVPVIGLVQVGVQAMADRYTYVPTIGIFIILSYGLAEWGKINFRTGLAFGSTAVLCFASISWTQIGYWKNSATVFQHALDVTSNNYTAHNYLARDLAEKKKFSEAELQYKEALKIKPHYPEALVNLGVLLAEQGKAEQAYPYLLKALKKDPKNPKINNNLGNIFKSQGELNKAVTYYKLAISADSEYKEAIFNLANTLEKQELFSESIMYYQQALQLDPKFAEAFNGMGVALARGGKIEESIESFKNATQLRPNYQQAEKNLALAKSKLRGSP